MGRFVEGEDRLQSLLLPETLDDYLTEEAIPETEAQNRTLFNFI